MGPIYKQDGSGAIKKCHVFPTLITRDAYRKWRVLPVSFLFSVVEAVMGKKPERYKQITSVGLYSLYSLLLGWSNSHALPL